MLGLFGRPRNPLRPRWNEPGIHDDRCDRCRLEAVPPWDCLLCPFDGCHWDLQLCDPCGGLPQAKSLVREHVAVCSVAQDSDLDFDNTELCTREPPPQLTLF